MQHAICQKSLKQIDKHTHTHTHMNSDRISAKLCKQRYATQSPIVPSDMRYKLLHSTPHQNATIADDPFRDVYKQTPTHELTHTHCVNVRSIAGDKQININKNIECDISFPHRHL